MHNPDLLASNSLSSSVPQASLSTFALLSRNADAPAWVVDAIRTAWHLVHAPLRATLIGVSENATFRVFVDDVPVMVVRLQRPGYVGDSSNVVSELRWIEAIRRDTHVRTPAPMRGRDDEMVQFFTEPTGAVWTAVAFEFVEGRILEQHDEPTPYFIELGEVTATLHQHARSWTEPANFTRFNWELSDMVGEAPRWGRWQDAALSDAERSLMERAQAAALDTLSDSTKSVENWGLIHSDLRPSNVMIEGDELTIIDFDDSGYSWYLYDFASALTFYEHRPNAPEMAANWISGYSAVLPLSRQDRLVASALSVIRRLTMLGWATTHREDALPADLWNENLPGTVVVAEKYLSNRFWLVE